MAAEVRAGGGADEPSLAELAEQSWERPRRGGRWKVRATLGDCGGVEGL